MDQADLKLFFVYSSCNSKTLWFRVFEWEMPDVVSEHLLGMMVDNLLVLEY